MYYDLIAKLDLDPLFREYWRKILEESIHIGLGRPRRRACRFVDYIIPIIPYYPLLHPYYPYYPLLSRLYFKFSIFCIL